MIAEILCIGSELLLGEIVNTNASYISEKLRDLGIDCYYQTTVGDNVQRIQITFNNALKRSDIIIITGGLGPTDDDITIKSIADFMGEELIVDIDSLSHIERLFKKWNRKMHGANVKQAFRPKNAKVLPNPVGTAPGIIWEIPEYGKYKLKKTILAFPGVPEELYEMWEETAHGYLKQFSKDTIAVRNIKYFGIGEAVLANKVKDLMEQSNPTVAPLVGKGETRLRIAAKAPNADEAEALLKITEKEILKRTKGYFYGYDDDTLEKVVGNLLKDKKLTLSVAESCTGGLISSRLTDVSGSSEYIKLNLTTYSNEAKIQMLGVDSKIIEEHGAVSYKTAIAMAEGIRELAKTDIGLSITGIAGPGGGTEEKPVGLVYIGLCDNHNMEVYEERMISSFSRQEIKYRASQFALNYLRLFLLKTRKKASHK